MGPAVGTAAGTSLAVANRAALRVYYVMAAAPFKSDTIELTVANRAALRVYYVMAAAAFQKKQINSRANDLRWSATLLHDSWHAYSMFGLELGIYGIEPPNSIN